MTRDRSDTRHTACDVEVDGEVVYWRGPAPHHFVPLPGDVSEMLRARTELSYGWGCVPATVTVGATTFETALIPKDGCYLVPIKVVVRRAEGVEVGDVIALRVRVSG